MAFGQFLSHPFVITLILLSAGTRPKSGSLQPNGCTMLANALPITSKPIENTAENLAWQAWLMLPPEQKLLEKSRKVTPKSIFTLPFRQCPEGHTLSNSRCIPTVQIDQTQLLTDQLLSLFGGSNASAGQQATYDYDYGEVVDDAEFGALAYDQPKRTGSVYDEQQPPSGDEPLKFSIFQQKFPTVDYAESGGEGSGSGPVVNESDLAADPANGQRNDTKPATIINVTQFLEAVSGYLQKHGHLPTNGSAPAVATPNNATTNVSISDDLVASSSQITSTTNLLATTAEPEGFSIDAIVLPAGGLKGETAESLEPHRGHHQKISLFKDQNSVQFTPSDVLAAHHRNRQHGNHHDDKQQDMAELLKVDALLPLRSVNLTQSTTAVPGLEQRPAETSESTPTKDEYVRSAGDLVGETTMTTAVTVAVEEEEDDTTDFQMDASTSEMIEVGVTQPQQHEAQRLAEEEEQRKRRLNQLKPHVILKKSKVEPVAEALLQRQQQGGATVETQSNTTPLPATATITDADALASDDATTDRFHYQHTNVAGGLGRRRPAADNGNAVTETIATDTTIAANSNNNNNNNNNNDDGEINIEQELRAINDLVKGRRQQATTTTTTPSPTSTIAATATATTSETSTTDVDVDVEETATTFIVGGKVQDKQKQQQQISAETTPSSGIAAATTTTITTKSNADDEKKSTSEQALVEKSSTTSDQEEIIDSTTTLNDDSSSSSSSTTTNYKIEVSTKSTSVDDVVETARSSSGASLTFENSAPAGELAATTTPATATSKMESTSVVQSSLSSTTPSTMWSKIMPIFSFATTPEAIEENPKKRIDANARGTTSLLFTFRANSVDAVERADPSMSGNSNRRNRNSKIRKFDEDPIRTTAFDDERLGENNKWQERASSSVGTTSVASTDESTTEQMSSLSKDFTTTSTTTTASPSMNGSFEPFWWLPIGWSLNGSSEPTTTPDSTEILSPSNNNNNNNEELPPDDGSNERTQESDSLLLRFWSAFPGNHIKANA